jgi:hypothetical protein
VPVPSDRVRLSIAPRSDNGLVVDATIETGEAAAVYVEYGNPEVGWLRTTTSEARSVHHLPLVRLRARTTYAARAFTLDSGGCPVEVGLGEFSSGDVSPQFGEIVTEATGRPSVPLVMMDLRAATDERWLAIFDHDWQPVWYYPLPVSVLRAGLGRGVNGVVRLANGNFLYIARNFGLEELTPDARVSRRIRSLDSAIHHDLLQLPDGRVLFLGAEDRTIDDTVNGGPPDFRVRGDVLYILDLAADYEQPYWTLFDFADSTKRNPNYEYRQEEGAQEWSHGNSIALGPRGNVVVSFRHLDQVISISPDLRSVEWRLGGVDGDFAFPDPGDRFYAQHSVAVLPHDRLVMFDNGKFRPEGEYSRGLELELDFSTMTARKVWEYRHRPDVFAASQSNAVRLDNGETLLNFGFREDPDDPTLLVGARPDGTAAWEARMRFQGQRTTRYRAYPLETIGGERPVEPTVLGRSPEPSHPD